MKHKNYLGFGILKLRVVTLTHLFLTKDHRGTSGVPLIQGRSILKGSAYRSPALRYPLFWPSPPTFHLPAPPPLLVPTPTKILTMRYTGKIQRRFYIRPGIVWKALLAASCGQCGSACLLDISPIGLESSAASIVVVCTEQSTEQSMLICNPSTPACELSTFKFGWTHGQQNG